MKFYTNEYIPRKTTSELLKDWEDGKKPQSDYEKQWRKLMQKADKEIQRRYFK
jgi:hypothetical protein